MPIINSVVKALDILQLFSRNKPELSLSEISEMMGMPKSTIHHILGTQMESGFIEKNENGRFILGKKLITVAQAAYVNVEIRDQAAPHLRKLGDLCNESIYLSVLDEMYLLYIYAIETSNRLMARTSVGNHSELHSSAAGKTILAYLPENEALRIIENTGMKKYTEKTKINKEKLFEELQEIKKNGYATDAEEYELNAYCIGAPIFSGTGRVIAACSISGTDPGILGVRKEHIVRNLLKTTNDISRNFGYVPDSLNDLRFI